jgi:hypothetical protein
MAAVARGRRTHSHTGDLTVFAIGMRINHVHRPDAWVPVLAAMGPMIAELARDPGSGFLGARTLLGGRGPTVLQYWRSPEDLYRYAADRTAHHRPAWTAFNARARKHPGAVGIWHETYQVAAAETMYVDVPVMGLAAATASVPVTPRGDAARARLAAG